MSYEPPFNSEELAVLRAQMDQAKAAAQEIVGTVTAFHDRLLDEGFPPDDALVLTLNYQDHILSGTLGELA